jgi:putative peptidoglycan lipid II flippase
MAGSVSWLYYADRLLEFPVGVLGVALATVVLPSLSKARAEEDWQAYNQTLDYALRLIWLVGLPATLALLFLAEPLMLTLFAYDAFSLADAHQASLALIGYALGLLGLLAIKVLAPAYYAREQMAIPVKISVLALLVNLLLSLLLIDTLAHVGLALAVSGAALLNAILLWMGLRYYRFYQPEAGWWLFLLRTLVAVTVMAVGLWWLVGQIGDFGQLSGWARSGSLLGLVIAGIICYGLALLAFGWRVRQLSVR